MATYRIIKYPESHEIYNPEFPYGIQVQRTEGGFFYPYFECHAAATLKAAEAKIQEAIEKDKIPKIEPEIIKIIEG